jgi:hypothetical protein
MSELYRLSEPERYLQSPRAVSLTLEMAIDNKFMIDSSGARPAAIATSSGLVKCT